MTFRLLHVSQAALQQVGNLGGRLEPLRRILGVEFADDPLQPDGNIGIERADRCRFDIAYLPDDGQAGTAAERSPAACAWEK